MNEDDRVPEQLDPVEELIEEEVLARKEETRRLRQARVDLLQHREHLVNIMSKQQEVHQKLKSEVDRKNKRLNQIDEACTSAQNFIQDSQRRSSELQNQLQQMRAEIARLQAEKQAKMKPSPPKPEKKCACDKCSKQNVDASECTH
uniref:Uncharacterized protein n=1 Tax=Acrobeloides nanus TaxID=290746 RepID=A0A914DG94_9BILA